MEKYPYLRRNSKFNEENYAKEQMSLLDITYLAETVKSTPLFALDEIK